MTAPRMRRIASLTAAAAFTVALSAGCTVGDWRYDAPPAAGVQADANDAKARNIVVISDDAGQAILLGSVVVTQPATVAQVSITALDDQEAPGQTHVLDVNAELPYEGVHKFEPEATQFSLPDLLLGRLAAVVVTLEDGRAISMQAPIHSSEHPDFAEEWDRVYG